VPNVARPTAKRRGRTSRSRAAATAISRAGSWYDARLDLHSRFAAKIRGLIADLLHAKRVQVDRIECRVKTRASFLAKAEREEGGKLKYRTPTLNIKDVIGVRVVTYLDSAVAQVCDVIEKEFQVDKGNSVDKDEGLGTDKVGYRSRHYVAELGAGRSKLVELAEFAGVPFEVQVRSMLQHAWAEVEHDRRFKYPGELPLEVRRRYSLIAGQLEIADRELSNLADEIDRLTSALTKTAASSSAAKNLTIERLSTYLRGVFSEEIASERIRPSFGVSAKIVLDELNGFGIRTVGSLAKLVPKRGAKIKALAETANTFLGVLRRAMMASDPKKYFAKAWNRRWNIISDCTIEALAAVGVDILPYVRTEGLTIRDA
jgi:ppGpp synthetase/RelA/SpoT-type nucleotidyltranferase